MDAPPITPSDVPIGVYSGKISEGTGVYHLELPLLTIDGSPDSLIPMTCFGMMNEDIYDQKYNVMIKRDGSLVVISTIYPGDELLTKYDEFYDWNWIKDEALTELLQDIKTRFPWVDDLKSDLDITMLNSMSRCPLHNSIHSIIQSKCWSEQQHSATPSVLWTGPSGLSLFLTSGAIYEKYRFGGFGSGKIMGVTSPIPRGKLPDYTDKWNGSLTAELTDEIIFKRGSDHIRSLRTLFSAKYKHRPTAMHTDCDSLAISKQSGRITVTLYPGSKKAGKRLLKALGDARSPRECVSIINGDKIWRCSIELDPAEAALVPGKGYCGFISMDRIMNATNRTLNSSTDEGLTGILKVIDDLSLLSNDPIQRAHLEGTKNYLVSKRGDWLSLSHLSRAHQMHADALLDTCNHYDYSRWHQHKGSLILSESKHGKIAQSNFSQWMEITAGRKLCFDSNHFFLSNSELSSDFQAAFEDCKRQVLESFFPALGRLRHSLKTNLTNKQIR